MIGSTQGTAACPDTGCWIVISSNNHTDSTSCYTNYPVSLPRRCWVDPYRDLPRDEQRIWRRYDAWVAFWELTRQRLPEREQRAEEPSVRRKRGTATGLRPVPMLC